MTALGKCLIVGVGSLSLLLVVAFARAADAQTNCYMETNSHYQGMARLGPVSCAVCREKLSEAGSGTRCTPIPDAGGNPPGPDTLPFTEANVRALKEIDEAAGGTGDDIDFDSQKATDVGAIEGAVADGPSHNTGFASSSKTDIEGIEAAEGAAPPSTEPPGPTPAAGAERSGTEPSLGEMVSPIGTVDIQEFEQYFAADARSPVSFSLLAAAGAALGLVGTLMLGPFAKAASTRTKISLALGAALLGSLAAGGVYVVEQGGLPVFELLSPTATEVSTIVERAAVTTTSHGIKVSTREMAYKAAEQWVGRGARIIRDSRTQRVVGKVSEDGMRVFRLTSIGKESGKAYINLVSRTTGGNLHVYYRFP